MAIVSKIPMPEWAQIVIANLDEAALILAHHDMHVLADRLDYHAATVRERLKDPKWREIP